jgi:hypothetical protein
MAMLAGRKTLLLTYFFNTHAWLRQLSYCSFAYSALACFRMDVGDLVLALCSETPARQCRVKNGRGSTVTLRVSRLDSTKVLLTKQHSRTSVLSRRFPKENNSPRSAGTYPPLLLAAAS